MTTAEITKRIREIELRLFWCDTECSCASSEIKDLIAERKFLQNLLKESEDSGTN